MSSKEAIFCVGVIFYTDKNNVWKVYIFIDSLAVCWGKCSVLLNIEILKVLCLQQARNFKQLVIYVQLVLSG